MRDLILKMSMSIDGFVSDLDGRNTWMFGDDREAKDWSVTMIGAAGLHIMGSRTFKAMAAHWPSSTDMFAPPMNRLPKTVFSRRGRALAGQGNTAAEAGLCTSATNGAGVESWMQAQVASGDLAEEIALLKARQDKPIIAHGGVDFARSLIARDLVDLFVLLVHPVALGRGEALFRDLAAPARFSLVDSRAFPGGAVAQTYRAG